MILTHELLNRPVGKPTTPEEDKELSVFEKVLISVRKKAGTIIPMENLTAIIADTLVEYNNLKHVKD